MSQAMSGKVEGKESDYRIKPMIKEPKQKT